MQYELFNWENRVADIPEPGSMNAWKQDLQSENTRIKAAFMEVLLNHGQTEVIERYVQTHQTGLLHLSLHLQGASDAPDSQRMAAEYALLFACLDDLYGFLEQFFGKYLSPDAPLPLFRSGKFSHIIAEKVPVIRQQLEGAKVEEALISVIMELLEEAMERSNTLTYRQWFPLREMMEFIESLPRWEEDETPVIEGMDSTTRIMELLYYLNVNTLPVYRYAKARIGRSVDENAYSAGQIPELDRMQRYFSWLEHRPGYRYMEARGSIIRMVSGWLDQLMRLKEKERLATGEEVAPDDAGFGMDSKMVITSLTVSELGLFVRLFMETGVFRTRNKKGLARFMAQNVRTLQKEAYEEVSSNSLYGTLYSTTDATLDSVQAILNRMITRLGKFRQEQKTKKPKPLETTATGKKKPG